MAEVILQTGLDKNILSDTDSQVDHKDVQKIVDILEKSDKKQDNQKKLSEILRKDILTIKDNAPKIVTGIITYLQADTFKNLSSGDQKEQLKAFENLYLLFLQNNFPVDNLKLSLDQANQTILGTEKKENAQKDGQEMLKTLYSSFGNTLLSSTFSFALDGKPLSTLVHPTFSVTTKGEKVQTGFAFTTLPETPFSTISYQGVDCSLSFMSIKDGVKRFITNVDKVKDLPQFADKTLRYTTEKGEYVYSYKDEKGVDVQKSFSDTLTTAQLRDGIKAIHETVGKKEESVKQDSENDNNAEKWSKNVGEVIYNKDTNQFFYQGIYKDRGEIKDDAALKEWKKNLDAADSNQLKQLLEAKNDVKDAANKLFGDKGEGTDGMYRKAWNALFSKNGQDPSKTNLEANKEVVKNLAAKYLNVDSTKIADVVPTGTNYIAGTRALQVVFVDSKTAPEDIFFSPLPETMYQARAEAFKDPNKLNIFDFTKPPKDKDGKISYIDFFKNQGDHLAFKTILDAGKFDIDRDGKVFLDEIITKKSPLANEYMTVLTDYVVDKQDISFMQKYLQLVNKEHMNYLGSSKEVQKANLIKISAAVTKLPFTADQVTIKEDMIKGLADMQLQLVESPKTLKEKMNDGVKEFFKIFGPALVDVLEMFGGKGCVKKFFYSMGPGAKDFYDKNFSEIEDQINDLYKEKFKLSDYQKGFVNELSTSITNPSETIKDTDGKKDIPNPALADLREGKIKKGKDLKTLFTNDNITTFKETFKAKIASDHISPAVLRSFIGMYNHTDPGKETPVKIEDYMVKTRSGYEYRSGISDFGASLENVFNAVIDDPSTWNTILLTHNKIVKDQKADSKDKELGLDENRDSSLKSGADIARYLGIYMLRGPKDVLYSVTENDPTDKGKILPPKTPESSVVIASDPISSPSSESGKTEKIVTQQKKAITSPKNEKDVQIQADDVPSTAPVIIPADGIISTPFTDVLNPNKGPVLFPRTPFRTLDDQKKWDDQHSKNVDKAPVSVPVDTQETVAQEEIERLESIAREKTEQEMQANIPEPELMLDEPLDLQPIVVPDLINTPELKLKDISDTLKTGNFDFDYLTQHKKEVISLREDVKTSDDIISNIKEVVASKVNSYLNQYSSFVRFDKQVPQDNFKMGLSSDKSSLLISSGDVFVNQPEDLKTVVSFSHKINIFDLGNKENTPIVSKIGDIVEYDGGLGDLIKGTGKLVKVGSYGSVEIALDDGRTLSGGATGIKKIVQKMNESVENQNNEKGEEFRKTAEGAYMLDGATLSAIPTGVILYDKGIQIGTKFYKGEYSHDEFGISFIENTKEPKDIFEFIQEKQNS